ncbi:hypothetical protein WMY93_008422 [Mugilogobius chulae]|uniref:Uncharacterized protein n=1 Tax=Mugilogobius chulae TaxID=88201 RepID=A0AAW0PKT7_9GOBI
MPKSWLFTGQAHSEGRGQLGTRELKECCDVISPVKHKDTEHPQALLLLLLLLLIHCLVLRQSPWEEKFTDVMPMMTAKI